MSVTARMEIAAYPLGTGNPSLTKELSGIFAFLDRSGLTYQVTVTGTIVEGPPDELFFLARDIHDGMFSDGVERVVTMIRIDEKRE